MRNEIEVLRAALESQRGWIKHWQKDGECNLKPTAGSLESALVDIEVALAVTAPTLGHNSASRLEYALGDSLEQGR